MSRQVAFEDQAISQSAACLRDDPDGVRSIFEPSTDNCKTPSRPTRSGSARPA